MQGGQGDDRLEGGAGGVSLVHQGAQRVALQARPQLGRHPPVEEGGVGGGGGAEGEGVAGGEIQDRRRRAALALQAAPDIALHPGIHRGDDVFPRLATFVGELAHAPPGGVHLQLARPGAPLEGGLEARLQPGPSDPRTGHAADLGVAALVGLVGGGDIAEQVAEGGA